MRHTLRKLTLLLLILAPACQRPAPSGYALTATCAYRSGDRVIFKDPKANGVLSLGTVESCNDYSETVTVVWDLHPGHRYTHATSSVYRDQSRGGPPWE